MFGWCFILFVCTVMEMFDASDIIWCSSLDIPPAEGSSGTLLKCRTSSSHGALRGSSVLSKSQTSTSILRSASQLSFFHCLNLEHRTKQKFTTVHWCYWSSAESPFWCWMEPIFQHPGSWERLLSLSAGQLETPLISKAMRNRNDRNIEIFWAWNTSQGLFATSALLLVLGTLALHLEDMGLGGWVQEHGGVRCLQKYSALFFRGDLKAVVNISVQNPIHLQAAVFMLGNASHRHLS